MTIWVVLSLSGHVYGAFTKERKAAGCVELESRRGARPLMVEVVLNEEDADGEAED